MRVPLKYRHAVHGRGLGQVSGDTPAGAVAQALGLDRTLVEPSTRVAQFALVGSVLGGLFAAVVGLAGDTIGPGNRTAVLGLLAIPVAGSLAGVLLARQSMR